MEQQVLFGGEKRPHATACRAHAPMFTGGFFRADASARRG